jgi:enamine deaminase RidA (YjgF/YER057c/UK114 family)
MRITHVFLACGLMSSAVASAGELRTNPTSLPPANGYSHVVVAPAGRLVVISGQVALDAKGQLVGGDDFEKQCVQVHENIRAALASLGLTFDDVIRTDNFITDRKNLPALREVRSRYLPAKQPPASTLLVVDGFFRPDLLVEISVEAILPPKATPTPPAS